MRLRVLLTSILILVACGPSGGRVTAPEMSVPGSETPPATLRLHEGLPPKSFVGDSGIQVDLVALAADLDEDIDRALLLFKGVPHSLAGKVLMATRTGSTDYHSWSVRFDGWDYPILAMTLRKYGSEARLEVSFAPPRQDSRVPVTFDVDATRRINPEKMIADHLQLESSGVLAQLAKVDRDFHVTQGKRSLVRTLENITTECQAEIPIEVNYQSYSDKLIILSNNCSSDLYNIAKICRRDDASRRSVLRKVKGIVCEYAKSPQLTLGDDGILHMAQPVERGWKSDALYDELISTLALTDTVVRDDEGRVLRFDPDIQRKDTIYFGDSKSLRRLALSDWERGLDPWGPIVTSILRKDDGNWAARCPDGRKVIFRPVDDKTRLQILKGATLIEEPLWKHRPFALARDDRGIYYYVDRYHKEFGGQNFRVFRGPRGQVRETTLTDIVDDSNGLIFATKEGKLRLILGEGADERTATWIDGKRKRSLVNLPPNDNLELIYQGLGVYDGESFGTICQ